MWRITDYCDLGCAFCGYSRTERWARRQADPEQVLAFGQVLADYQAATGRAVLVSWLGGEPLLWPPLWSVSHVFKETYHLRLGVTTNGTRLESPEVQARLTADYDQVTVSLDGGEAFHDRCRQAPGLYRRLLREIRALKERVEGEDRALLVRVNTILMRDTIADFESLCELLAELGVDEVTFNALGGRERPEFFPDHALGPEHSAWLRDELPGIRERMQARGLRICGSTEYVEHLRRVIQGTACPVADCRPGADFLYIDTLDVASPCSFTTGEYGIPLSQLTSAQDLIALPGRFAAARRAVLAPVCHDCPSTQVWGKFEPTLRVRNKS
ncbi:MAG: radical SAM protein [Anaerolineae bacterium]